MKKTLWMLILAPLAAWSAAGSDWPALGGSSGRNAVSAMKGAPVDWDPESGENVRWVARLGSQTYGSVVVAGGRVYIGTNNENPRHPDRTGDMGVLMAFRESDGAFLWQAESSKLPGGGLHDWPMVGVCSSPLVEGDRVYFVNNRDELVSLDAEGFADGENDGPFKSEPHQGKTDADVVWKLDMIGQLGVFPHNASNSSPAILGDLLFVGTSNGRNEDHSSVPKPDAPSLVAVDKNTGKVVWTDHSPGRGILNGQWTSPTVARIGGVDQVIIGQGDGWVRAFEARTGKKLWEFDTNPKDSQYPKTRNEILGAAVVSGDYVYIANGQDPENGEGDGRLFCIDGRKRGDITVSGKVWEYNKIRRSISTPAIHEGLIYIPDFSGFLHCLDAKTGQPYWVHDTFAAVWGSPAVVDGKVYLGDEDGDIVVLQAGKTEKVLAEINMGQSVYSTPAPANGTLYIASRDKLFAVSEGGR